MPRVIKKKVKQKKGEPDLNVQDRFSEIKTSLRKKQKSVLIYSLAAVAMVLVVSGYFLYRYTEDEQSRTFEYEAYKYYHGDFQKQTLSPQERYQKALDLFTKAYNKKKSARLALYLASTNYELARYYDTITGINLILNKYSSEKDIVPLAYQLFAKVKLKMGSKDEALKALETLYKAPGDIYKDYALIESARILEGDGKKDEAAMKYRELTEKFKDSPFVEEAKSKLGKKQED